MTGRNLKKRIFQLLQPEENFEQNLTEIIRLPARKAVNPLFSFFYHRDERVKWRAVTAMGAVVARLAASDPESARVVMRRLMWNLNDESGGIGWGSPEAMGEIIARSERLAEEFCRILISYADPAGNFLEHEVLQRGVLWGWGRAAQVRASMMRPNAHLLIPFFGSEDPYHRGLAAWTAGWLATPDLLPRLEQLRGDASEISLYRCPDVILVTVGRLSAKALEHYR